MPVTGEELRRLSRRLAIGLYLDAWPPWAAGSLLLAGVVTLICRVFFPAAFATPALAVAGAGPRSGSRTRSSATGALYSPADVVALADSLTGGTGTAAGAVRDRRYRVARVRARGVGIGRGRSRGCGRGARLAVIAPAAGVPGRGVLAAAARAASTDAPLADDIAADLDATLAELKQQELITPAEEARLEEEIERIRQSAEHRVDASSWEAADALREQVAAGVVREAERAEVGRGEPGALRGRGAGRRQRGRRRRAGAGRGADESARTAWRSSGLLAGAPADLQRLLKGGKLPTDAGVAARR